MPTETKRNSGTNNRNNVRIKELPSMPEYDYSFKCPKCGGTIYTEMISSVAKVGGEGIGYAKLLICVNCRHVVKRIE